MYPVAADLDSAIDLLMEDGVDPNSLVVVEESPDFPGELVFQAVDSKYFYSEYRDWLSRFLILNQPIVLRDFVDLLVKDGRTVLFGPSCQRILENYEKWGAPLHVGGFTVPGGGELYPYQTWSINRALEQDSYFYGWCPGSGKSLAAAAGAQELFNRGEIDLVLAFTLMKLKHNLRQFFTDTTQLRAVVNDGTPQRRSATYKQDHDVFVLNYEKAQVDYAHLLDLVQSRRTLFVLDEASKILTDGTGTLARKSLNKLIHNCSRPIVWPMSATVVAHSPFKYRDVFSLDPSRANPLGTKIDFERRYVKTKKEYKIPTKTGRFFRQTVYEWDLGKLHEVRHRVTDRAHNVRKTDPGVRENFQGMQTVTIPVQMSDEDRELYAIVTNLARISMEKDESIGPHYRLLRYICNNPEALLHTNEELGQQISREHPGLVTATHSAKLEMFLDKVEEIRDSGDRVVAFTTWTNLSLFLLHNHLTKRKIRHVLHYGVGQSSRESQKAQTDFKTDDSITLFLSSDAGAYGLNLQECRYAINYEVPYSYDIWTQRINRIDRADSYLDGLTAYNYVTEDSVEERIWGILNSRRELAAATLGTNEVLSYGDENNRETLAYLVFGV